MTVPVSQTLTPRRIPKVSLRPLLNAAISSLWMVFPLLNFPWMGGLAMKTATAQEPAVAISKPVESLIVQLGGNQFAAREQAGQELFELGPVVLPELQAARSQSRFIADNHECSMRLDQLIGALTKNDREARIKSFLGGSDDELENWPQMRRWFGDQPRVREMFVELYRAYPEMVQSLGGSTSELTSAIESIKRKLFRQQGINRFTMQTRIDILAMLIPMTEPNFRRTSDEDEYVAALLQQHAADEFRRDRILGESFLGLVRAWMERSGLRNREFVLRLAMEWEMPIGAQLAKRTLALDPKPDLLARCLQTISRQGTEKDMALIVGYLDDKRIVYRSNYLSRLQNDVIVADVAAATIAYLANVPVTEIGFAQAAEHNTFGIIYEKLALPLPTKEPDLDQIDPDAEKAELPKTPQKAEAPKPEGPENAQQILKAQLQAQRLRAQQLRAIQMQRLQARRRDPEIQLKEYAEARAAVQAAVEKLIPKTSRPAPQEG